ncbi:hypothetical protein [Glycomyces sp. YM15]|uniref:hypothetical protein n=1 Tax=Glycomyces sp. YM15 TaxID=2800446 RepID=UPI001F05F577|nr:hypothetical protein [Glycomyces sp. YM15]
MKIPNQIQPGQPTSSWNRIDASEGAYIRASRPSTVSTPSRTAPIGRHFEPGFVVSRQSRHHR